jgi:hypothetical protein
LNEKKRLAERDVQKARAEARKKERAARKQPADKAWVVDLETIENGKPLALYSAKKTDEEKLIATKANPDPEADEADEDSETVFDAQLTEGLNILHDYTVASKGITIKAGENVALKKSEPTTATP